MEGKGMDEMEYFALACAACYRYVAMRDKL